MIPAAPPATTDAATTLATIFAFSVLNKPLSPSLPAVLTPADATPVAAPPAPPAAAPPVNVPTAAPPVAVPNTVPAAAPNTAENTLVRKFGITSPCVSARNTAVRSAVVPDEYSFTPLVFSYLCTPAFIFPLAADSL